eukprot:GHVU01029814.1.p1 GENE.GHVU01029814.1~~GHVU01029814.1.p1  ORF type:complete len:413 (-),score=51.85 GHVU01029814.1:532-1770(-)
MCACVHVLMYMWICSRASAGSVPGADSGTISSRWTPRPTTDRKVKIQPPSSDNYADWTPDQLRAECTSRKFRLPASTPVSIRRLRLEEDDTHKLDEANAAVAVLGVQQPPSASGRVSTAAGSVGESGETTGQAVPIRRSAHCIPRLLNTLFSDGDLRGRLMRSGDQQTWQQLGSKTTHVFWDDVATAYNDYRPSMRDHVITGADGLPHSSFATMDPAKAHKWPAPRLSELFKDVQTRFNNALLHFRKSGNHDPDFSKVRVASGDVVYLWFWLQQYPETLSFVKGGLPEAIRFDSLGTNANTNCSDQAATTKAHRVAAADRTKREGEAYAAFSSAMSTLSSQSSTNKEAELQGMLDGVVGQLTDLHTKAKELTAEAEAEANAEVTELIQYYQKRRRTLQERLDAVAPSTAERR